MSYPLSDSEYLALPAWRKTLSETLNRSFLFVFVKGLVFHYRYRQLRELYDLFGSERGQARLRSGRPRQRRSNQGTIFRAFSG